MAKFQSFELDGFFLPRQFQLERLPSSFGGVQFLLQNDVFVATSNLLFATPDFVGVLCRHRTSEADVVVVPPIEIHLFNPGTRG